MQCPLRETSQVIRLRVNKQLINVKDFLFQSCYMLEAEARRCYIQRCRSNIYHSQSWIPKSYLEREFRIEKLASMGNNDLVEKLNTCAQDVVEKELKSFSFCSQAFHRGLMNKSLHHDYLHSMDWLKG